MQGRVEQGRAGFAQALAAEWTKLRTVRSALWTLAAMAASVLGIAVFVGATGSLQPDDTVLGGSLTGATFGLFVGAGVGVLVISRDYAAGTIGATLMACPRRGVVLAAKATVTAIRRASGQARSTASAAAFPARSMSSARVAM